MTLEGRTMGENAAESLACSFLVLGWGEFVSDVILSSVT